jgi:hypothetical protein
VRLSDAEVWPGLRTVIKPDDGNYVAYERSGEMYSTFADAVLNPVNRLLFEHDAEGFLHVGGSAGKPNGASRHRSGIGLNLQLEFASKRSDQLDGRRVGSVPLLVLCTSDANWAAAADLEWLRAFDDH